MVSWASLSPGMCFLVPLSNRDWNLPVSYPVVLVPCLPDLYAFLLEESVRVLTCVVSTWVRHRPCHHVKVVLLWGLATEE